MRVQIGHDPCIYAVGHLQRSLKLHSEEVKFVTLLIEIEDSGDPIPLEEYLKGIPSSDLKKLDINTINRLIRDYSLIDSEL